MSALGMDLSFFNPVPCALLNGHIWCSLLAAWLLNQENKQSVVCVGWATGNYVPLAHPVSVQHLCTARTSQWVGVQLTGAVWHNHQYVTSGLNFQYSYKYFTMHSPHAMKDTPVLLLWCGHSSLRPSIDLDNPKNLQHSFGISCFANMPFLRGYILYVYCLF